MNRDKNRKAMTWRNVEPETQKKGIEAEACTHENGDRVEDEPSPSTLSLLRKVVSEVVAKGMRDRKTKIKKELLQSNSVFETT